MEISLKCIFVICISSALRLVSTTPLLDLPIDEYITPIDQELNEMNKSGGGIFDGIMRPNTTTPIPQQTAVGRGILDGIMMPNTTTPIPQQTADGESDENGTENEGTTTTTMSPYIPGPEGLKFELENTMAMLDSADERVNPLGQDAKNTVLVLGNAGAGKTTFVQFLAGDNSKLLSKEIADEFVIEDGLKIGSSTESLTLYPELVMADDTTAYCDTPGFSDTRSPSHEIVTTYAMKNFLSAPRTLKIVLLVTYPSVQYGVYKDDFIDLLRNVNELIKDVDKYKDNIMLVATKVTNLMKYNKKNYTLVPDENIVRGIAKYLNDVNKSIADRIERQDNGYQLTFLENAAKLINSLLETDADGKYRKINIFRRPNEDGPLANISLLQEAKAKLKTAVENNLSYVQSAPGDWGYTLSDRAKLFLEYVVKGVNDMIVQLTHSTFNAVESFYKSLPTGNSDLYSLIDSVQAKLNRIKALQRSFNETCNFDLFYTTLVDFVESENIQFTALNSATVSKISRYTERFQIFTNVSSILTPATWFVPTKNAAYFLEDTLNWYEYLRDLFKTLSSYDVQKSVRNFNETKFAPTVLEGERMEELKNVISKTVKQPLNVSCSVDGTLKLEGVFVKLNEIFEENLVESYCGNYSLRTVVVFALNTVFIDADLDGKAFSSVNVEIVAPVWEVIGSRRIVLTGQNGSPHEQRSASNGSHFGEDGVDGLPGRPGKSGGHFLGVGMRFVNGAGLTVMSNGGDGSSGQNGGSGRQGADGVEAFTDTQVSQIPRMYPVTHKWSLGTNADGIVNSMLLGVCSNELEIYKGQGSSGKPGGKGGDGGYKGLGGFAGELSLIELKDDSSVTLASEDGTSGDGGSGGNGGGGGQNGPDVVCYNVISKSSSYSTGCTYKSSSYSSYYNNYNGYCQEITQAKSSASFINCLTVPKSGEFNNTASVGQNGISNHNKNNIQTPVITMKPKSSSDFKKYALFLEDSSNSILFNRTISEFMSLVKANHEAKRLFMSFFWPNRLSV